MDVLQMENLQVGLGLPPLLPEQTQVRSLVLLLSAFEITVPVLHFSNALRSHWPLTGNFVQIVPLQLSVTSKHLFPVPQATPQLSLYVCPQVTVDGSGHVHPIQVPAEHI